MSERVDVVVLGAGPAGEHALGILIEAGLSCALVERELIGGECSYWACMPSKTLLRPPEVRGEAHRAAGVADPALNWPQVRALPRLHDRAIGTTASRSTSTSRKA